MILARSISSSMIWREIHRAEREEANEQAMNRHKPRSVACDVVTTHRLRQLGIGSQANPNTQPVKSEAVLQVNRRGCRQLDPVSNRPVSREVAIHQSHPSQSGRSNGIGLSRYRMVTQ